MKIIYLFFLNSILISLPSYFRLFHLCLKRRGSKYIKEKCAGTCDKSYNQICDQMYQSTSDQTSHDNMSVYTVEMRGSQLYNDSEHVYQDIRDILKDKSDIAYKMKNHNVENKVSEHMVKNIFEDKRNNISAKDAQEKPSIVYGMITVKEVARYVPCTQNVIIR